MDTEWRIRRLERRVRVLSALLGLAVVGLMLGAAGSVPKEVRARSFVLVGPDGKDLAAWQFGPTRGGDGIANLSFFDRAGKARAAVACTAAGHATMGVYGPDGQAMLLSVFEAGSPMLQATDKDGQVTFTRP